MQYVGASSAWQPAKFLVWQPTLHSPRTLSVLVSLRLYTIGHECGYGGWTFWNGGCYKLFNGAATWSNSRQICANFSADLVSIQTALENDLVNGMCNLSSSCLEVWIGLSDFDQDGKFAWADGTTVSYTSWASLQPSNGECVYLSSAVPSKWSTDTCQDTRSYICKKLITRVSTSRTQ